MQAVPASWNIASLPALATAMEAVRRLWEAFLSHTEEPISEGAGLPRICSCLLELPLVQSRGRGEEAEQPLGKHDKNTEIVGKSLAVV